jgi:hypothetical protein
MHKGASIQKTRSVRTAPVARVPPSCFSVRGLLLFLASIKLAQTYISKGVIPAKKGLDARHIAVAAVNAIDIILSYNFKHINKLKTKAMIPAINLTEGYQSITIAQSEELIDL